MSDKRCFCFWWHQLSPRSTTGTSSGAFDVVAAGLAEDLLCSSSLGALAFWGFDGFSEVAARAIWTDRAENRKEKRLGSGKTSS
jgi:hypothetical protein